MAATTGVLTAELTGVCSRAISRVPVGSAINSGFLRASFNLWCSKSERSPAVRLPNSRTPAKLWSISRPSELEWVSWFVAALEETEFCSKRSLWAQDEGLEAVVPGHPRKRGLLALTSVASRYCEYPVH